jgi:uncharacterized protein YlzI (FlbEa/FlbD family)
VITLATGGKVVVMESPEEVTESIRDWRAGILDDAWRRRHARQPA